METAAAWFQKPNGQGNASGLVNMEDCYDKNRGGDRNPDRTMELRYASRSARATPEPQPQGRK